MSPTARSRPTRADAAAATAGRACRCSSTPLIAEHRPDAAAVEEVFVNTNPQSTLKLGQARGVVLLMCARRPGIEVGEYAPRLVKKAVVGTGAAEKAQVHAMVSRLLPGREDRRARMPPTRSRSRSPTRIIWRAADEFSDWPCPRLFLTGRARTREPPSPSAFRKDPPCAGVPKRYGAKRMIARLTGILCGNDRRQRGH